MGKFGLQIKATLDGVTDLKPQDPFVWIVQFKCSQCGEESKDCFLDARERIEGPTQRSDHNLVMKCKMCSRVNTVDIVEQTVGVFTADDNESFKTMLVIECRGLEPIGGRFDKDGLFSCKGQESGTKFADIDLNEGEWSDYDEKAGAPTTIFLDQVKFVSTK